MQIWQVLMTAIVAPIVVNTVSHALVKLFDEWLDNRHKQKRRNKRKHKRH